MANFQSPTFLNFRPDGNGAAATLYDGFESLDTAARAWIALDDGQGTKTVPDNSTAQELAQATARTLFSVGRHYRGEVTLTTRLTSLIMSVSGHPPLCVCAVLLPRPVPVPYPFIESGYLSLLTRVLPNMVYGDDSVSPWTNRSMDERVRGIGRDWPERAHTMVGVARLMNTQFALQDVMARGVMGDFLEAGVWRGGVYPGSGGSGGVQLF